MVGRYYPPHGDASSPRKESPAREDNDDCLNAASAPVVPTRRALFHYAGHKHAGVTSSSVFESKVPILAQKVSGTGLPGMILVTNLCCIYYLRPSPFIPPTAPGKGRGWGYAQLGRCRSPVSCDPPNGDVSQ